MALQNFVEGSPPPIHAAWLNQVDLMLQQFPFTPQGNITLGATSGTTLTINTPDNVAAIVINDAVPVGGYYLGLQEGGALRAAIGLGPVVFGGAGIGDLGILATGTLRLGGTSFGAVRITNPGNVLIATPGAGAELTIGEGAFSFSLATNTGFAAGAANIFSDTTEFLIGTRVSGVVVFGTSGKGRLAINSAGNITINAADGNVGAGLTVGGGVPAALVVNGTDNTATQYIIGSVLSGQSYGLYIQAGSNAVDNALLIRNSANSFNMLRLYGDGGLVIGPATGNSQSAGSVNISGQYYINGVPISGGGGITTGSFVGQLGGCTTTPTTTFNWVRSGNVVCLYCAGSVSGVSNSTNMSIAVISGTPNPGDGTSSAFSSPCWLTDNGVTVMGSATQSNGGLLNFAKGGPGSGGFTASGTKGLPSQWTMVYTV